MFELLHLDVVNLDSDLLHGVIIRRRSAQLRLHVALQLLQPLGERRSQPGVDLPHLQDSPTPLELLVQSSGHGCPPGGHKDDRLMSVTACMCV